MRATLVMARTLKRVALKYADLGSALWNRQFSLSNSPTMKTRGQETSTTPTIDPKSSKDRPRLPTHSQMDAMSIGALNDDATVLDAAIQQARIDSVLRPVQRLAPGILDWAQASLLRALQGGTTFASISQAQEWLGQQVAQNFYDPKDGYTFDIRRLLGDLLTGGFLSQPPMTPEVEAKVLDYYVTQATHDYSLEDYADQATANLRATSRTAAGTRVRLPTPSEQEEMSDALILEALEELLAAE